MHLLYNRNDWTAGLVPGVPQVVLAGDRGDMLVECKQINPQCVTILRHVDDGMQIFSDNWEGACDLARRWWSSFIDGTFRKNFAASTDYVKGYNETLANSQNEEEVRQRILMERALAHIWNTEYRVQEDYAHIRPVLGSAAVGNDIPEAIAYVTVEYDAVLSYHAYMYYQNRVRPDWEKDNLSGRWMVMEENWFGTKPEWCFTEGGPFESAITGWRSPECLDGYIDEYVEAMRIQFREIKASPAWRAGRVLGPPVWFTTGGSKVWKNFYTNAEELEKLSAMLAEEWEEPVQPPRITPKVAAMLWKLSLEKQCVSLNPNAALQIAIDQDDFVPVMSEDKATIDKVEYTYQAAEDLRKGTRRVYVWLNGEIEIIGEAFSPERKQK